MQVPEFTLRSVDTALVDDPTTAHIAYNDKYVIVYDYSQLDVSAATKELTALLHDLESVGLQTEVRAGYEESLLVFVQAPRELLGNTVHHSRVKDWLYGITKKHPGGSSNTVVAGANEAEDLMSLYHLVTWTRELGGAGITPGFGKWKNVASVFPLHNPRTNTKLLVHLSKKFFLTVDDLDQIRDLWGTKVAFYFAFIQSYFLALIFPCVVGVLAWAFLPKYSLVFAVIICVWCTVFLESWKIREIDLSIRWKVRGVGKLKVNRPQFQYEKEVVDDAGRVHHIFPRRKRIIRQLAAVPFLGLSTILLTFVIATVFALETFIVEGYDGPYDYYLEYIPTVVLALLLPFINNYLEKLAARLTEYENHRTEDYYEMSLTQKIFVLQSISNYLPIFLVAFVYVPFGQTFIPHLRTYLLSLAGVKADPNFVFHVDPNKLRNEVITLTVTGQLSSAIEELALPYFKNSVRDWWRTYRTTHTFALGRQTKFVRGDDPIEAKFLRRVRKQASLAPYDVHDDISEMVLQFGYLALFSPVWPLIPIGFFINNWFELRADIVKISIEHQRPTPIRNDGIGPWVASLEALTWLGSLTSAAIVHLFGFSNSTIYGLDRWWTLPITIFASEHIFLLFRAAVRWALHAIGSEHIRKERSELYAERKKHLDELEASSMKRGHLDVVERERRKSVRMTAADVFWTRQVEEGASRKAGAGIIRAMKGTDINDFLKEE
ncbi:hypothetical protein BU23DRAFT_483560 [Bimuria novae-zelandiae CBS 107.79]|uniref:DUF590-domain-containing protein n=1 Tax=Bimuria novae-zelandiae CBS 107.79 TaxID=1447943 RepID=A0A6A5UR61_9PLEO|nr:hypothetical protein BU23DRAFT_483560 [Bimuria novae-zelandiae CBS 107.79]